MKLDDLEALLDADTVEQVWAHLTAFMDGYGFDRLLYGYTRFRTANSFGDPQDLLILSNADEVYVNGFINQGLYFHAPMVRWAAENVGACSWRWISEMALRDGITEAERKVLDFNEAHAVTSGYSISFKDSSIRSKGALGLIARAGLTQDDVDAIWEEHGRKFMVICNVAHMRLTCLPYSGARRSLTRRQKEALEWVGDGKTTQDIAQIMGLTPATVEKHLRLAREALNVETTAQAVLKASFQNQIFAVDG
ncbi:MULTISPECIES: LuxR family transcriptional regulator [Actibacterium]|uniref:LuxR family transcriptional regulator n=1 Tax=Actibacterium naphthalenivorans TaxID=1614693 RepID=A0A840CHA9_9RHOB|nr:MULTISPECIES: LuxR family transcriptional regulator [Actibacterium]ALG90268.1 LuxR family transcriptional regulator [Actibacterium sp. EMB200-NS6]MBB4022176.1 LuxR family transcriptional regulator [Actibacterium naphthalenivorans]